MEDNRYTAIEGKKMMYITSLLNEALPSAMLTTTRLEDMGIDDAHAFGLVHILYNTQLQATIESKDASNVADWKDEMHRHILRLFDSDFIRYSCVLNLSPYTRTIVYSFSKDALNLLKEHIRQWFHHTNAFLQTTENAEIMAFANPRIVPFKDIGKLYKELRRLQNYQYVIGMGNLTFYSDFDFSKDYSMTEYKYIQRYEILLSNGDFVALKNLNRELRTYIQRHVIKDSKVIYIYKELMSITIRYLYTHETEHLRVIKALNHTINNFSSLFNDLTEVADYIDHIRLDLEGTTTNRQSLHPHIKKILQTIESSYSTNLTLDAIADGLSLSDAYLSRLFKEEMGITYKQYLTRYRLDIIKDLLVTTNKSINAIAALTGYQTANQLTRIFKKYEQLTPRSYRQHL